MHLWNYIIRRSEPLVWALSLYAAWTLVWVGYGHAADRWPGLRDHGPATLWWFACKLIVWIVPIVVLVRRRSVAVLKWLGLASTKGLLWAGPAVIIVVVVFAVVDSLVPGRWPQVARAQSHELAYALVIGFGGPLLEETLFRGYAMRALRDAGSRFWIANILASVLFALLHVPGWLFLGQSVSAVLTALPAILLSGVLFGAFRMGNASLWPSVLMHVANNAWSGGWILLWFHSTF